MANSITIPATTHISGVVTHTLHPHSDDEIKMVLRSIAVHDDRFLNATASSTSISDQTSLKLLYIELFKFICSMIIPRITMVSRHFGEVKAIMKRVWGDILGYLWGHGRAKTMLLVQRNSSSWRNDSSNSSGSNDNSDTNGGSSTDITPVLNQLTKILMTDNILEVFYDNSTAYPALNTSVSKVHTTPVRKSWRGIQVPSNPMCHYDPNTSE